MEESYLTPLVVGFVLVVISTADSQAQYQLRRPVRNFVPNRFGVQKGGHYPPVPPDTRRQELPGDNRNFIPNRFDIPASIMDRKPGASTGCVGASPCGLVPPASPPALPMPPAFPVPAAFTGYTPQNAFQGMPQDPYNSQGFPAAPAMAPGEFNGNSLAQNTGAAVAAKAKLLGGIKPGKKFVPHLPPMGRPQQGKPPYDPPPPTPEPQVAGYGPAAGQLPYQQPLSFGLQGMAPPQPAGYAPQPVAGFAPQPAAGFPPPTFTGSKALNQFPPSMGAQQHDEPQLATNNAPQVPFHQVPFSSEMNQGPTYPGQQMPPDGSFDLARKRMMTFKVKGQMKRFGVPRPVLKSRLVPKPLFKRHS